MKYVLLVLLLAGALGVYLSWNDINRFAAPAENTGVQYDKIYSVKRGGFLVTLSLDGTLKPIRQYSIEPLASSRLPFEITYIIDNNMNVKKGDVICRFSDEIFKGDLNTYIIDLENEKKNLKVAHEELNAQEFNNIADIKNAAVAYRQAREALVRYRDEDSLNQKRTLIKKLDQLERAVTDSEKSLYQSVKVYNENQDQNMEKRLIDEVMNMEKNLEQFEEYRDKAFYDLKIFKKYTYNEQILKLQEEVTKSKLGLQNNIIIARSLVVKHQQNINVIKKKITKIEADIYNLKNIIAKLEIIAEVDGIFTKSEPNNIWGRSPGEYLVGTEVRYGQQIGTIPDMSQFLVEIKIPEAYRSHITHGLSCQVKIKSIPGLKLYGSVNYISTIAENDIQYDKNSPKHYPSKIFTKETDPRLTPGMTVNVDVMIEEVKDVLYVPIESVYNRDGLTYIRVENKGKVNEVKVKVGRSSMDYVEITDGIKEGDNVVLNWESAT